MRVLTIMPRFCDVPICSGANGGCPLFGAEDAPYSCYTGNGICTPFVRHSLSHMENEQRALLCDIKEEMCQV